MSLFISKKKWMPFTLAQVIFIALMSVLNVVFDLVVSPGIIAIFTHIIAGIFIMVPVNFIFISITRNLVPRFGTLTLYLAVFGTIAIPTTLFGGIPGPYKILVGVAIGLCLDLIFLPRNAIVRVFTGGLLGGICWWFATYTIWQAFGFPFVRAFSLLVKNSIFNIPTLMTLPIMGFGWDFVIFTIYCGILSAIPVLIATGIGFGIFTQIRKTAVYKRFLSVSQ